MDTRRLDADPWSGIARNYPGHTRTQLGRLMAAPAPEGTGRLLLWHGEPGTGKTAATLGGAKRREHQAQGTGRVDRWGHPRDRRRGVQAAVLDRKVMSSPCVGTKLPKIEPQQVVPLTTAAVHALTDALPARYKALAVVAAGTGLRQGEAFGLTVDRVDFFRRTLTVDRQLVLLPGQQPHHGPPKTRASYRTIPLPQVVVRALVQHLKDFPAGPDGLIFTDDAGAPLSRTTFSRDVWRPAAREAKQVGATCHDLRHYYASLLIQHGESVKVVQARLGHATAAETLDTYSHLWPDSEDQTRVAIDSVLGAPADSLRTNAAANT